MSMLFTPEKVRELLSLVATSVISGKDTETLTTNWLEQNQPEPVVVWLSDEQVVELAEVVAGINSIARIENRITGCLMTQKLAQSNTLLKHQLDEPRVEVGQVWRYKDREYTIKFLSSLKCGYDWVESVNYIGGGDKGLLYTRTLEDFLTKFELVK